MSGAEQIIHGGGQRAGQRIFSLLRYINEVESGKRAIYVGKKFCVLSTGEFEKLRRAAQSAEVRPDTAQQLKAEIADLANELQDFNDRRVSAFGRVTEIVAKMRQLSAV